MANKGLGKGLGALISLFDDDMNELDTKREAAKTPTTKVEATKSTEKHESDSAGISEIDINLIDNNTSQPRKNFNLEEMHELEQSISVNGVLQPILLNRVGSRYMIVAGERRWRACKNIGMKKIPAIVRNYSTKQVAEIALIENLLRSDLNEIEIANGIKKLMDTHLMTQEQVSRVLGKDRSVIANSLRFLNLPNEVQELLEQKRISAGHAKCLASFTDKKLCVTLAHRCAAGMTVRELESYVTNKSPRTHGTTTYIDQPAPAPQSLELKQFAFSLTLALATKVSIQGDDNNGKIVIDYTSKKDIERIATKLGFRL